MLKRFNKITGSYIKNISGQKKLGYTISDETDFYSLVEFSYHGGYYGSVMTFFDFDNGNVYTPFEKQKNVIYSRPIYKNGFYYFLKGDYDKKKIELYKYSINQKLMPVKELNMHQVNLYNLGVIGDSPHIISQTHGERFECYYPERFSFPQKHNETAIFISDNKIYFEAWFEEGWDKKNHRATDKYKYYSKIIIRDYNGSLISEEIGSLYQAENGTWWIS